MNSLPLRVFILTKNEVANIKRCLDALRELGVEVALLDTASTDGTREIASKYEFVKIEDYKYVHHLATYNEICMRPAQPGTYSMIIDADMVFTPELRREVTELVKRGESRVAQAPIAMWWCGRPLQHGSAYPPKPFLFRNGEAYFIPVPSGEEVRPEIPVVTTSGHLIHDDRKPYQTSLYTQVRYAEKNIPLFKLGIRRWRDKLRYWTPLMILLLPLYSLIVRRAFLSGRVGFVYALDRLIAEAILYRQVLVSRFDADAEEEQKKA